MTTDDRNTNADRPDPTPLDGLDPAKLMALGEEARALAAEAGDAASTQSESRPRARLEPWPVERVDAMFASLDVLELVGAGGMGAVYRAQQKALGRDVALKLLHPELAAEPGLSERFTREARALASLSHPNIVTVHDVGVTEGVPWLVMEYVEGTTLRDAMRGGDLDGAAALSLVGPMCEALQYAHDAGVVHRDIKPENVLLARHGGVKVADFGLAKIVGSDDDTALTMSHQVMGTLRYMAPEQFDSPGDVDHRADIYSLGVVVYEMLTGHVPQGRFDPPSLESAVDARIDDIVLRALERQPWLRYQQAADVKTDVDAMRDGPPAVPEPAVREPAPEPTAELMIEGRPWTKGDQREEWRDVGLLALTTVAALIGIWTTAAAWAPTTTFSVIALCVAGAYAALSVMAVRRHEPRLRDAWRERSAWVRSVRSVVGCLLGFASYVFVMFGVVAMWEMYCPRYAPPVSSVEQATQLGTGFAMTERVRAVLPDDATVRIADTVPMSSNVSVDIFAGSPMLWLVLAAITAAVAGGMFLDARPAGIRRTRALLLAWTPALAAAVALCGLAVYSMTMQALDQPWPLRGVAGSLTVEAPIASVRRAMDDEFGILSGVPREYEVEAVVRSSVRSEPDYEPIAEVDVYLASPAIAADRWDPSNIFVRRDKPKMLIRLTGDLDGQRTHIEWNAGAYPSHDGDAQRWQAAWETRIQRIVGLEPR